MGTSLTSWNKSIGLLERKIYRDLHFQKLVCSRVGIVQLFGTKGQKFPSCPGTKGQRDKLKFFPWDGTGRDFDRLSGTGQRDNYIYFFY